MNQGSATRTWTRPILWVGMVLALLPGCNPAPPNTQRLVAIGDIHADINVARNVFRLAGATDENGNWIGGDLVVVQTGDLIGRSYEDREVLDFLIAMRDKAEAAGGKVHILVGNHEVFGARIELGWVSEEAYAAFDNIPDLDLDSPRLADLPESQRARSAALMPGGHYAKRMAEFPAVLKLGDTIFAHGGVTPHWANYGIDKINDGVSLWFSGQSDEPVSAQGVDAGNDDDSVMMSRHFSDGVGEDDCAMLEESLAILGAKRMVVAHTVHESITSYCNEQVWAIDAGMSRFYGGDVQVLEIINGNEVSVIHD